MTANGAAEPRVPELRVLGAGSILPREGYGCAGYALVPEPGGPVTLLDCGPGTVRNLAAAGIELTDVRRVVLSHYHLDHCLDLFALFFARRNPGLAGVEELEVVGPPGLEPLVHGAVRGLGDWAVDPLARLETVRIDGEGRGGLQRDGLDLRCTVNGHSQSLTALSWRVERSGGWSLAYTGDTCEDPRVTELARGVDLLVAECSFADEEAVPNHLTPSSAGALARDASAGRLLLTHFYPGLDPDAAMRGAAAVFDGPIEAARDGSVHPVVPAS